MQVTKYASEGINLIATRSRNVYSRLSVLLYAALHAIFGDKGRRHLEVQNRGISDTVHKTRTDVLQIRTI